MEMDTCTVWLLVLSAWVALYTACGLAWWRRERHARRLCGFNAHNSERLFAPVARTAEEERVYGEAL